MSIKREIEGIYGSPAPHRAGVGPHPHRGFETVTLSWEGAIAHHDSMGNHGVVGPGDVQWMTAQTFRPVTVLDARLRANGPFVMNTQREIREALYDFQVGKFGHVEDELPTQGELS